MGRKFEGILSADTGYPVFKRGGLNIVHVIDVSREGGMEKKKRVSMSIL